MSNIDYDGIISDVENRLGQRMPSNLKNGYNGPMIRIYPWQDLPSPWKGIHVEATPEKLKGMGFSVHLDFIEHYYERSVSPEQRSKRQRIIHELEADCERALLIIGRKFRINPRKKQHFLVEQEDVVLYNEWGRDAKIAELLARYITAFNPAIHISANAG